MKLPRLWISKPSVATTTTEPGKTSRPRLTVRGLMFLVLTSGLIAWAVIAARDALAPAHEWARQVRDGTLEQRRDAVIELGRVPARDVKTAVPALAQAVGDRDEQVASRAVRSLGDNLRVALAGRDPAAARPAATALIAALKDKRPDVRAEAAGGLAASSGQLGDELAAACQGALAEALSDSSEVVRATAASALGETGPRSRTPPPAALVTALNRDPSARIREAAALSLGLYRVGLDQTTLDLIRAMETSEPPVRERCTQALAMIHSVRTPGKSKRTAAIVPALIELLGSRELSVRFQAANVLGEIGPDAAASIPALIKMLGDPNAPAGAAAMALGEVAPGTPQAGEAASAIIAVVRDESRGNHRARAAEGLMKFGPPCADEAMPVLLGVAKTVVPKGGALAQRVCYAMGGVAPGTAWADKAVAALRAGLDSSDDDTCLEAVDALGHFGSKASAALPRLREIAKVKEEWVRKVAKRSADQIESDSDSSSPPARK